MNTMIENLFGDGSIWTRKELTLLTDMPDRSIRNMIREARRQGVPIMALPSWHRPAKRNRSSFTCTVAGLWTSLPPTAH